MVPTGSSMGTDYVANLGSVANVGYYRVQGGFNNLQYIMYFHKMEC
jgi:hypothetical protein